MTLPAADKLIARVRAEGPAVLDEYAPEVDELADVPMIADYLGLRPRSIHTDRARSRWPDPAPVPGRTPLWTWRSVITYRASMPGPGNRLPKARKTASKS